MYLILKAEIRQMATIIETTTKRNIMMNVILQKGNNDNLYSLLQIIVADLLRSRDPLSLSLKLFLFSQQTAHFAHVIITLART
jgi:hypothetical protein